ncbi:MAG: ADP-ribosylglycohydrolase family protein [Pseudomonadota bacterium]
MIIPKQNLRDYLTTVLKHKGAQGHDISAAREQFEQLGDSYDELIEFGNSLADLPIRPDWEYVEPYSWEDICAEMDPARATGPIDDVDPASMAETMEAAFLSCVAGCILGKPIECNPSFAELKAIGETVGEWPIQNYITTQFLDELDRRRADNPRKRHRSWATTTRDNIHATTPDDDINYTVMGMLMIEEFGVDFTQDQLREKWLRNLPAGWTFGPERTQITNFAIQSILNFDYSYDHWTHSWNLGDELCGAAIRADAYGYAAPGNPALAAHMAFKDSSMTHVRNGVYGTMYIAAAIATAATVKEPLEVHRIALQYIPQQSRLAEAVSFAIEQTSAASDWEDAYWRINERYSKFQHCRVYQEVADLVVTLNFAENIHDGFCKQVMMGNDTDSFGCTSGSMCGAFFGPGHLDEKWLAPFNNRLQTTLADFHEQDLRAVAKRCGQLPAIAAKSNA